MRRHHGPHSNHSAISRLRRTPLLWCGLGLLVYALYRVYCMHGDLHELHQSLDNNHASAAAAPPADVQVIMAEGEDELWKNATSRSIQHILAYPHIDECRQCQVCVPQSFIDQQLGNSSSSRRWWGRLWRRQLLEQQQQLQEQSHAVFNRSGSSSSSKRRRGRGGSWLQQRQQWLAALLAAGQQQDDSSEEGHLVQTASAQLDNPDYHLQHQQQQQQQQQHQEQGSSTWRRQLQKQQQQGEDDEPHPPGYQKRPRLDGVKTHKAWLAKQAAGEANTNTHAVPGVEVILNMPDNAFTWQGARYHIGPASLQMDQGKIRHCKVCRGCRQRLMPMPKGIHWLSASFLHDPGASDGWLSTTADAPAADTSKRSVVKVWCIPVPKPGSHVPAVCKPAKIREQLQLVLALQNIAQDCQLGELLPHTWIGPVDGVLPGSSGYRVLWDGLWSDLEVGVAAENLVHRGEPPVQPPLLLNYLQHKLNSTQVLLAAVFDLLFSQCDRHGQNLYLKPDGSIVLIDNDQSYGASWRPCGVDSLFLPGTQKFEIERLGYSYVMKKPEYAPPKAPRPHLLDPLQLLDYRCHLPGGKQALGTDYPKPVAQCLRRLAKMDPDKIASRYGYPHPRMAAAVHQRAKDMLAKGFEWTLRNGWPHNPLPMRYKWSKGCCQMRLRPQDSSSTAASTAAGDSSDGSSSSGSGTYECTGWVQEDLGWGTELPVGDPITGMAWEHNGVDSGSYSLEVEGEAQAPVVSRND